MKERRMSLTQEYLELTKMHVEEYGEKTLILMQCGSFFEAYGMKDDTGLIHGCQLNDFSRICDLHIVEKNSILQEKTVVNAGFKTHLIDKYLKKLQENGYTIAVYEEVGDDPVKNTKIRALTGIYSPGTFFDPFTESEQISNNLCCIWIEYRKNRNKGNIQTHTDSFIVRTPAVTNMVHVGIGRIDIYTGNTCISEFCNEYLKTPTTFDELERFISIYQPSECIIVSNLPPTEIVDIISYVHLQSKTIHLVNLHEEEGTYRGRIENTEENPNKKRARNCEKQSYQVELLHKFYTILDFNSFMHIFYDNVYASQAFCFLLDFANRHNPCLVKKLADPVLENNSGKLVLANHSLKQLNIICDHQVYNGKYSSVHKMLNECITPMGKRRFSKLFLNPIIDANILQQEYDMTEYLLENVSSEDAKMVKNLLVQIKDLSIIMRKIISQKASPKIIYQLHESIRVSQLLHTFILNSTSQKLQDYLKERIPEFGILDSYAEQITKYLNEVLILEDCKEIESTSKIEKSFIQHGVNSDLDYKIKKWIESYDQLKACRTYFNTIISNYETMGKKTRPKRGRQPKQKETNKFNAYNMDSDEKDKDIDEEDYDEKEYVSINDTEKNNYSLVATERRCKLLEEAVKNNASVSLKYCSSFTGDKNEFVLSLDLEFVKQSQSKKSIRNSQINEICKNVGSVKDELIDGITKVFLDIVRTLQSYQTGIDTIVEFITHIDIIYNKAFIAKKYNYCKPEIVSDAGKSFVQASNLRHCLIEKIQQTELYVANNISLGTDVDGILLYGTNAVGKTSFIRALGISVVMAQAGLFVPASKYVYRPYRYIFTRILGNDNLFEGLSTFAVEMLELRAILQLADENSLVIGDELCSGTESISATSLFVSGIQHLASVGCSFIFATHLHEIVQYDEIKTLDKVKLKHMSVVYDKEKDCLVYDRKLKDGPGHKMYGLEVCKSLKLPEVFLQNAHSIRMKYHPEMGSVLDQKPSHFNAKHISGGICDKCNVNKAEHVHHLIYQHEADETGVIQKNDLTFNKNNKANIINVCKPCHDNFHENNIKCKKTKTTAGIILKELY